MRSAALLSVGLTITLLSIIIPISESFVLLHHHHRPQVHIHIMTQTKQTFYQDQGSDDANANANADADANEPTWCEEQQIYINGTIASSSHAEQHINAILSSISQSTTNHNHSTQTTESQTVRNKEPLNLHIFGYGSLCWNPGSIDEVLANPRVERKVAKAVGWKRCWCQKSTDHRGNVSFPGLVCTLLSDEEIRNIKKVQVELQQQSTSQRNIMNNNSGDKNEYEHEHDADDISMTEGVLYTIPSDLVEKCLAELDFREKGGYARDVIDVLIEEEEVENGSHSHSQNKNQSQNQNQNQYQKALLYRGTPDNPAFSKRALLDMNYAASIMAVAQGPSGTNDAYLYNLDKFLSSTSSSLKEGNDVGPDYGETNGSSTGVIGDQQTKNLAALAYEIQKNYDLYFLFGTGSNQHNQLLLSSTLYDDKRDFVNAADLVNGEDAHELTDIVLAAPKLKGISIRPAPRSLYAGGGHSAMLTDNDDLYLWGWNDNGQLGRRSKSSTCENGDQNQKLLIQQCLNIIHPLGIKVEKVALGQSHTLIIEKSSQRLYCFGDDSRGQVSGIQNKDDQHKPIIPPFAQDDKFVAIAAGVFHSAAITTEGELITFGCSKFSQSLQQISDDSSVGRWKPDDGSRLIQVACGRRHTMVLDEHGRVWTMGENWKYGQLGRPIETSPKRSNVPELVNGILGTKGSGCVEIDSGWSHNVALVKNEDNCSSERHSLFAWGRCDKFQYGRNIEHSSHEKGVDQPQLVVESIDGDAVKLVSCGSESLVILTERDEIYGCGWNEHGNLGLGCEDVAQFSPMQGTKIRNYESLSSRSVILANGGAHFLACMR